METVDVDFARFVELNAGLAVTVPDPARRAALVGVARAVDGVLGDGAAAALRAIPRAFGEAMGPFGWAWNGFYARREGSDALHVSHAHGPPVCVVLERQGGPLTSGMCFDGIEFNQTLAAYDAKAWPGYVSCDASSGLGTVAGIVSPVRDASGAPVAVWDLDSTEPIQPGDVRFVDVLFATLARRLSFTAEDFA